MGPWKYFYFYAPLNAKGTILLNGIKVKSSFRLYTARRELQLRTRSKDDCGLFIVDGSYLNNSSFIRKDGLTVYYTEDIPQESISFLRPCGRGYNGKVR